MSDTLTLLNGATQDTDGPEIAYTFSGETVSLTASGTTSGGNVYVETHDPIFTVWSLVATLSDATPTATVVISGSPDAIRARLVGSIAPSSTVTAATSP